MFGLATICTLAALSLTAPEEGSVVPVLRDGQRAYMALPRAERFQLMDTPAERIRLASDGEVQPPLELRWEAPSNAVSEVVVDFADGGAPQSVTLTNRTSVRVTNLESGRAYRWTVRCADEEASATFVTAGDLPRLLRCGGVANFRDLGGWRTADGRRVRQGMVFRSAGLRDNASRSSDLLFSKSVPGANRVTPAGVRALREEFDIRTDIELRSDQEAGFMVSSVLGPDVAWARIPFAAYDFIDEDGRGRRAFAALFRLFLRRDGYPVLFHCSGGRDRTGTLAFLLNGLLGVSEDDLCRDWEATIFGETSGKFSSDRIRRLLDYLKIFDGDTIGERIAAYARACGIGDAEIAAFRDIMLESEEESK